MKTKLFFILTFGVLLMFLSLFLKNIYLLGLSEIIIILTSIFLFKLNIKNNINFKN